MKKVLLPIIIAAAILSACSLPEAVTSSEQTASPSHESVESALNTLHEDTALPCPDISSLDFPAYSSEDYIVINDNSPFFTENEITAEAFEQYSDLDDLGRCGTAFACIGAELMPTEPRGEIGMIKPSGWQIAKYDFVDGTYLYNRCHLIGYQLTGENANERNLITGTRYMNIGRMEELENKTAEYIRRTGNHVMYRVTPIFSDSDLVASGVLMEARSVEDNGTGLTFCNYVYNVQPNVSINYADGTNSLIDASSSSEGTETAASCESIIASEERSDVMEFVLNTNTKKYHTPDCPSVNDIKPHNKQTYIGTVEEVAAMGYAACKRCH